MVRMDLQDFKELLNPAGQEALQAASSLQPREVDFLEDFTALSRRFPPNLARAALETAILRLKAQEKFPFAGQMYFTREALEQASSFEVSSYRVGRYRPFTYLADLGCSIGGDSLSLASLAPTLGIDLDPLRLAMAGENLKATGARREALFLQADLNPSLPLTSRPDLALFFDPARRAEGRRIFSVQEYLPPLSILHRWLPRFPAIGVKASPGIDLAETAAFDAEVEFISLQGELKEAVLWLGLLKESRRRATLLPGPHSLVQVEGQTLPALPLDRPRRYLYEPDPAVLRAGLVALLGAELGADQLDPSIAYLTSHRQVSTPFARCWEVEDWLPFNLKRLRETLRQRGIGQVVVKKRGSPIQPEALIHDLRLKGEEERVVFLTQLQGRPIAVICFPERI